MHDKTVLVSVTMHENTLVYDSVPVSREPESESETSNYTSASASTKLKVPSENIRQRGLESHCKINLKF